MSAASAAGPAPADLKKLRLAHIDPPIKAPEFRLMDLNRQEVSLSEFGGKGILVYFWASWWHNCTGELPSIHVLHEKVKDKGIEFVLVNIMESAGTVKEVVEDRGYKLPVLLDTRGEAARKYKVWGTPGVYLINSKGYVVAVGIGRRDWDNREGIAVVRSLAD
jgi:peroxiredoxin